MAGYHLREIKTQGKFGEVSKIREELEELEEALQQPNRILAICELADLYGAIEAVADKLGVTMSDVATMAEATMRAFKTGERSIK
jgi:phosphoribosyl-ATP pyrophosphohydrolase